MGLLPDAVAPTGTKTIAARTEHLAIEQSVNGHANGSVDWIEHLGDQNHLHVRVGDHKLVTLAEPGTELQSGDAVTVELLAPLYFDAAGERIEARR